MSDFTSAPWEQLFPARAGGDALRMRLVRKRGEPLLLLPGGSSLATLAMTLYPAQTGKAQVARWLVEGALSFAPALVTEPVILTPDASLAFPKFLAQVACTKALPRFAMLLGNPRAPGRRFVLLLFNDHGLPAALVKAGVGESATRLIQAEHGFLKTQPAGLLHAPQVLAECLGENLHAFAMEYIVGTTPNPQDTATVADLLHAWLQPEQKVGFMELSVARRLDAAASGDPHWVSTVKALREAQFHPAIHHGDFAPWNVRVNAAGSWRVLDWERGEAFGPPAWDWFHWVIQHEILVHRTPTMELIRRIEVVLAGTEFRRYAERAGIVRIVWPLLVAYLLYSSRVIRQADGLAAVEALLARAAANIPTVK